MTSILEILLMILSIVKWIVLVHIILSWLINFQVLNLRQPVVAQIWFGLNQLLEPICMASVASVPDKPGWVVYSNPYTLARDKQGQEIPGGRGKRENLTIRLSRDFGRTWPVAGGLGRDWRQSD